MKVTVMYKTCFIYLFIFYCILFNKEEELEISLELGLSHTTWKCCYTIKYTSQSCTDMQIQALQH